MEKKTKTLLIVAGLILIGVIFADILWIFILLGFALYYFKVIKFDNANSKEVTIYKEGEIIEVRK